ncbi:MAG: hypothetical protein M1827_002663 [Pycnora praestabilis]|nr:MAG: hypothetical protein M1827_002663 [Pycnora praestabilis]
MDTNTAKTATGYVLSCVICAGAIQSIVDPVAYSTTYGIPINTATSDYVPVLGARELALGLAIGTFMFRGEKRAAGVVLCTALVAGLLDAWFISRHAGRMTGAAWSHVVGNGLAAAAGAWLMG